MSCLIAHTYNQGVIYEEVIQTGLILLIMIMAVMAIQNPYNSCMGPNEDQYRTLSLACSNAFFALFFAPFIVSSSVIGLHETPEKLSFCCPSFSSFLTSFGIIIYSILSKVFIQTQRFMIC